MVFERPAVVASLLTSCFAWDVGVILLWEPSESSALARGVAGRGIFDTLRWGVNGVEVGTKREGFGCISSRIG
jgi:hypothetical protein